MRRYLIWAFQNIATCLSLTGTECSCSAEKEISSKMQEEREQYATPQLKLVGETNDVVLGGIGLGGDISGMWTELEMEFQED
jgi:hypothetical protein